MMLVSRTPDASANVRPPSFLTSRSLPSFQRNRTRRYLFLKRIRWRKRARARPALTLRPPAPLFRLFPQLPLFVVPGGYCTRIEHNSNKCKKSIIRIYFHSKIRTFYSNVGIYVIYSLMESKGGPRFEWAWPSIFFQTSLEISSRIVLQFL